MCSGIEAATVAWHPLGWTAAAYSEIEKFPSQVLAHHYPDVPNLGDMTKFKEWPDADVNVFVGGTPCQSFSVAGLRAGLDDPRGNLMLTYLAIAERYAPRWIVWENVPGVLSSNGGRDFGSFLGAMGLLGYGVAYRVLDAQWCRTHGHPRAVPQRRRRVFVVGCLGDWTRAAQVLFERESVQRDSSPRRTPGQGASADAEGCAGTVSSKWAKGTGGPAGDECYNLTTQPIGYRWQNNRDGLQQDDAVAAMRASTGSSGFHEMNHPVVVQPVPFTKSKRAQSVTDDETWVQGQVNPTLSLFDQGDTRATTVAVGVDCYNGAVTGGVAATMGTPGSLVNASGPTVMQAMTVRRLTPRECERLQGFPDDWTLIPWRGKAADQCPDGPRYKALGNSMAVNCMEWIGERIAEVSK